MCGRPEIKCERVRWINSLTQWIINGPGVPPPTRNVRTGIIFLFSSVPKSAKMEGCGVNTTAMVDDCVDRKKEKFHNRSYKILLLHLLMKKSQIIIDFWQLILAFTPRIFWTIYLAIHGSFLRSSSTSTVRGSTMRFIHFRAIQNLKFHSSTVSRTNKKFLAYDKSIKYLKELKNNDIRKQTVEC